MDDYVKPGSSRETGGSQNPGHNAEAGSNQDAGGGLEWEANSNRAAGFGQSRPQGTESPKSRKGLWAALAGLLVLLSKFKFGLLFLLGKLKFFLVFFKFGKFITTFGSMFVMIWFYAQLFGWAFGIGFVLLIFVHEMGHFWTAKRVGLKVSAPLFIPFLGAFIALKEQPRDAVTEAQIAMGGPVLGSVGAFLCASLYPLTGQDFWLALAYTGFMINLFNLVPVHPLDGGRIVSAISPKLWLVGLPLMLAAAIRFFNPILLLLLILGATQVYRQWKSPDHEYYHTPPATRAVFAALYFGLIILLGTGMAYIYGLHGLK